MTVMLLKLILLLVWTFTISLDSKQLAQIIEWREECYRKAARYSPKNE